jgi:hypothetical protein
MLERRRSTRSAATEIANAIAAVARHDTVHIGGAMVDLGHEGSLGPVWDQMM